MKPFAEEKKILPEYPRIFHLPFKPNAENNDLVASEEDAKVIFEPGVISFIEEKIDGANCGMALVNGEAVIRNRDFILRKGYRKETPAKMQFASVWTWFYENKEKFQKLDGPLSIYGEWCVAQHGIFYDKLPAWFIAYDLYDYEKHEFVPTLEARKLLSDAGFAVTPLLYGGRVLSYETPELLVNGFSQFTSGEFREGIVLKIADDKKISHRFKMVRPSFIRGAKWSQEEINKNKLCAK